MKPIEVGCALEGTYLSEASSGRGVAGPIVYLMERAQGVMVLYCCGSLYRSKRLGSTKRCSLHCLNTSIVGSVKVINYQPCQTRQAQKLLALELANPSLTCHRQMSLVKRKTPKAYCLS